MIKSGTTSATLVGTNSRETTAMEVREVDRDTDLMVFGSDGELQTREGRYFGADKTGRRGFTYRLHFVMQVPQGCLKRGLLSLGPHKQKNINIFTGV